MKFILILSACFLASCSQTILGLNRGQRMTIYGDVLDIAGHPELGEPLKAIARTLDKQPREVKP